MEVEVWFYDSDGNEQTRVYSGISCSDALKQFDSEFPYDESRPIIHHMKVENGKENEQ